jgi:hypothetical protein
VASGGPPYYGRWSVSDVYEAVLDGTWVSPEELGGMVLLTPTSIAYTGTSATIGTNGSVDFTACSSLSLNGVFSADYDNYMIGIRVTSSLSSTDINCRLRASGSDASASNDYVAQYLVADSTSVSGGRITAFTYGWLGQSYATQRVGISAYIFGPYLTQPTAVRSIGASDNSSARLVDIAWTHDLSTSYDGLTVFPSTGNFTGLVSVYGLVGA